MFSAIVLENSIASCETKAICAFKHCS
uniref:Uncharacterized protein n=1 Tax=Arundo donax TaxID=35708 RepID=A0A0A9SZA9_ARUDO